MNPMTDIPIVERLMARRAFQYAPANAAPQTTWAGQATSVPPLINPDGPEAAALLKECVEALEAARGTLGYIEETCDDDHYHRKARDAGASIDATLAAMARSLRENLPATGGAAMTPTKPEDALVEQIRELQKRATPGPWKIGMVGGQKMEHVVDMGEPPKAPFIALHQGAPRNGAFIGQPHFGVVHSDGDRCEVEANAQLIALVPQMADGITTLLERERRKDEALERVERYFQQDGHSVPQVSVSEVLSSVRAALTGDGVQPDQTS